MDAPVNYFAALNAVNVAGNLEKKGGFSYLRWPYAIAELRTRHPDAKWQVMRFNGLPFLKTECGYFVEVEVTVNGINLSQIHPVLNHQNKPILSPTAFDINTSIQRCLVKAIALHGLGLFVYAGEDLPPGAEPEPEPVDPRRESLLAGLTLIAKEGGMEALGEAWKASLPEDRQLVGPAGLAELKALAEGA